jgi:hypothetical protein
MIIDYSDWEISNKRAFNLKPTVRPSEVVDDLHQCFLDNPDNYMSNNPDFYLEVISYCDKLLLNDGIKNDTFFKDEVKYFKGFAHLYHGIYLSLKENGEKDIQDIHSYYEYYRTYPSGFKLTESAREYLLKAITLLKSVNYRIRFCILDEELFSSYPLNTTIALIYKNFLKNKDKALAYLNKETNNIIEKLKQKEGIYQLENLRNQIIKEINEQNTSNQS